MKFDVEVFRYIEKDAWRVLVSVEMGMKNHELVPVELINAISGLKHGGAFKFIRDLLKHKLVHHDNSKYDAYRLTPLGYDYLAIKAFVNRGAIEGVGRRIGVGKESDVYEVVTEDGETLALKLHRLGRTSFRAVKSKRDYIKKTTTHTNWLYLSRLAALKEHAFMKALGDNGFPVPVAVDVNRHAVLMSIVDGYPLTQVGPSRLETGAVGRVYKQCVDQLENLARHGLVHCDFNEFNIMVNPETTNITVIDFPQMVSTKHPNAEELFVRDLKCLHKFFLRRFDYRASEDPDGRQDPVFFEIAGGGVGHGAGEGAEKSLDVSLRASGFTQKQSKELEEYQAAKEAEVNGGGGDDDDDEHDDDEDDDSEVDDDDDDDNDDDERGNRFGRVERGDEEVEGVLGEFDVEDDGEDDPEAEVAAMAAVARLYGGAAAEDAEAAEDDDDDEEETDEEEEDDEFDELAAERRSKKWKEKDAEAARSAAGSSAARRPRGPGSVSGSSMWSGRSRADQGNDPDLVRARLKQQAARKGGRGGGAGAGGRVGSRNHTKDRGGKRGAKHHAFTYKGDA